MLSITNVPLFSYDNKSGQIVHVTILVVLSSIFISHFNLVIVTVELEFVLGTLDTALILGASWDYTLHGTPWMQSNTHTHIHPHLELTIHLPCFLGGSRKQTTGRKCKTPHRQYPKLKPGTLEL